MNAKATRMLFAAVALSALAALLACSAQARTPEGNGTRPPSRTVVNDTALAAMLAGSAQARKSKGNGTQAPSRTVVYKQQPPLGSEFFVDPAEIRAALTPPRVVNERQAPQASATLFVDPVYASLDPAIRIAILARSHAAPLAAKQFRTGKGEARLEKFPDGYSRLNP